MDKGSQLVLTANGHIMGERFVNSGPLALVAHFASTAGKAVASVVMFEGVPGRNGTVSELSGTAGDHHHAGAGRAFLLRPRDPGRRQHAVVGAGVGDASGAGGIEPPAPSAAASASASARQRLSRSVDMETTL